MLFIVIAAYGMTVSSGWLAGSIRHAIVTGLAEGLGRRVALGGVGGDLLHGIDLRDLVIAERGGFSHGVGFSVDRIHLVVDLGELVFHPGDVQRSISRADLYNPHLALVRDGRGAWNLDDLTTPGRSPLGQKFHGRLVVHDGSLAYADSYGIPVPPFATRFAHVNGTVDYRQVQQVALQLRGQSTEGEEAAIRGRYLPETGVLDLDVTARNGAARHWGGYLVRLSEIRWVGGRFDGQVHVLGTPSGESLAVDYTGTLNLTDVEAEYLPTHLALRQVSGTLALDTDHASTAGLTLTAGGSPVRVQGDLAYPGGGWLDLAISSPGLDLSAVRALFFPTARLGLAGQAGGSVWITGPVETPYLDGDVTSASGRLNRQAFQALRARFQFAGGTLTLSGLRAELAGGRIAGDAVLDVSQATPSYLFAGTADNLDVSALPAVGLPVTGGLIGRATGEVVGAGTDGRVRLMAGVTIGPGSIGRQGFRDLHARFWDDDGAVDLDFLRAGIGATTVFASGHVARSGALDLAVAALGVSLGPLGPDGRGRVGVGGVADLDGRLSGTAAAPVLAGAVTAWGGHLGPVPFAFARGDLTVSSESIASRSFTLEDGAATYRLSGALRLHPLTAVNLRLDAAGVQAASLAQGVTGIVAAHVALNGPLAHPSGAGEVTITGGSINGQRVDRVDARFTGDGRRVQITSLDAQRDESRLHVAGMVDPQGPIDLTVSASRIRLADFSPVLGLTPAPRGTLELEGTVRGTLRSPALAATLHAPDLMIGTQIFDASGTIAYQADLLHVAPLALTQGDARYSLAGDLRGGAHPSADLTLDVTHGQIATIVRAGALSLPADVAGTIDGSIRLTGPLADPSAHLSLVMRDAAVGGMAMGGGAADLTLSHGSVDIQRLELTPGQGQIAAKGQVILNGTSAVEVSARDLDPNILRPFFHIGQPLAGKLNFTMQWTGATHNPTAGLSLEAVDAGVPGAVADRVIGLIYYKDGTIHIEDGTITKGSHKAVIQGTLPVASGGLALDPGGPLRLALHLQDSDLSLLGLFVPRIHDAGGAVEGEVSLGGTVGHPEMTGTVKARDGHMRVDPLGTPIEHLNVDIAFSQDQILAREITASVGGGQVQASGTVGVSNLRLDKVALDIAARGVTATVPGLYAGGVDAALTLSGRADRPVLAGTVTLSHGRVAAGEPFERATSNRSSLGLDLILQASNDIWLNEGAVRAELGGSLHVGGTLDRPALSGTVRSLGGTLVLMGTSFQLTQGQAVFSEALGLDPQVSARAQALYGDTRVYLDVNGVLPDPAVTWSAEPPLSQSEILGLVAGSSSGSNAFVGQGVGRLILGSVSQALRTAFHLDELTIAYDSQNPVTLRIGKFLVRNLYLALSQVFGRTAGTGTTAVAPVAPVPGPGAVTRVGDPGQTFTVASLEYFLSPTFSLSYSVDTLGNNGVFLLTRVPF